MYQRDYLIKLLVVAGLTALAAIAAWQFYLFATFKDANGAIDIQGGTLHLWLAIGIAVLVCIGGFFFFSRVLRYDKQNEMHITSAGAAELRKGRAVSNVYAMRRGNGD